jgi:hypothetical protein
MIGRVRPLLAHPQVSSIARSPAEGLGARSLREHTARVNRLDQLFARSHREIEAHAVELAATQTGRYYIDEAAHLLAGLRLWAQTQYRSDQVVREILEAGDATALLDVVRDLRAMKTRENQFASWSIGTIAKWPAEQLAAVSSYALQAL